MLRQDITFFLKFFNETMKSRKMLSAAPKAKSAKGVERGFDYLSKTHDDEGDAVGEFMKSYPIIKEVNERHPLLEEFLIRTSVRLSSDSRNYAAIRLFLGVVLSTFDSATDVYMYFEYRNAGELGYANATLTTLLLNLSLQLFMSFMQNRKTSKRKRFFEALYVVTLIKPGVDAYRVAIGAEQEIDTLTDPKTEMVTHKGLELFTEAIPGTCIQMYAFFAGSTHSSAATFSLFTSVITASFTSTGISYDLDTDRVKRTLGPDFYGYTPGGAKKIIVVACMFFMSMCQLGSKAFVCALCAVTSKFVLLAYLLIDMALFFALKLVRKDFMYWPQINGKSGFVVSAMMRVGVKIIADFTGLVQLRHPYELGGYYWAWTLLSTPIVGYFFGYRKIPEWNESQPEWWDSLVKATIPDWAVHDKSVFKCIRSLEVEERRGRRRSSANLLKGKFMNSPSTLARRMKARSVREEHKNLSDSMGAFFLVDDDEEKFN
ncbi:hypothetical protein TrLO_g2049 [Triparma laevis f. longispina]|uniref:Uncharacterized protein n=1 Tax=Triparma laevis f. longispina TaxID=1714387 RepID=A0A9W7FBU2_9STRA|nr:hypothetical protein TrLO_g2049 [Triparma laevis f. longispina]